MAVPASVEIAVDQPGARRAATPVGALCRAIPIQTGKEIRLDSDISAAGHLFSPALGLIHPRPRLHGATHCSTSNRAVCAVWDLSAALQPASAFEFAAGSGNSGERLLPVVRTRAIRARTGKPQAESEDKVRFSCGDRDRGCNFRDDLRVCRVPAVDQNHRICGRHHLVYHSGYCGTGGVQLVLAPWPSIRTLDLTAELMAKVFPACRQ